MEKYSIDRNKIFVIPLFVLFFMVALMCLFGSEVCAYTDIQQNCLDNFCNTMNRSEKELLFICSDNNFTYMGFLFSEFNINENSFLKFNEVSNFFTFIENPENEDYYGKKLDVYRYSNTTFSHPSGSTGIIYASESFDLKNFMVNSPENVYCKLDLYSTNRDGYKSDLILAKNVNVNERGTSGDNQSGELGDNTDNTITDDEDSSTDSDNISGIFSSIKNIAKNILDLPSLIAEKIYDIFVPNKENIINKFNEVKEVYQNKFNLNINLNSIFKTAESSTDFYINYKNNSYKILDMSIFNDNYYRFKPFVRSFFAVLIFVYNYKKYQQFIGGGSGE